MLQRFKNLFGKSFPKNLPKNFRTARTGNSFTLKATNYGKINVECDLVRSIVERAAKEIEGIHEVSVMVEPPTDRFSLDVTFSLSLLQGYSAQNISTKLVATIQKIMADIFQLSDVGIHIKIDDVVQVPKQRSRRVR